MEQLKGAFNYILMCESIYQFIDHFNFTLQ